MLQYMENITVLLVFFFFFYIKETILSLFLNLWMFVKMSLNVIAYKATAAVFCIKQYIWIVMHKLTFPYHYHNM